MDQKGFVPIFIIIVILVLSGIIVGSSYFKQQNAKNNASVPVGSSVSVKPTENPPSDQGEPITLQGIIACLPHKNTSGPQTLECAIGLRGDNTNFYGLRDLNQEDLISGTFANDTRVSVTGKLIKDAKSLEKYDVVGDIQITTIEKL